MLFSVIEGLEYIHYEMRQLVPELNTMIMLIVASSPEQEGLKLRDYYDTLKRSRNATFHVPNNDEDRRRQTMNIATYVLYKKELDQIHSKVKKIIDDIKVEIDYFD